jgi:hypothetical protein
MSRQGILIAVLCAIGGVVVGAWLAGGNRDADESQVSELRRRLDTVERQVADPRAPAPVPGVVELRDQGAPPPGTSPAAGLPPDLRAGAVPGEQAMSAFADAAAAAERRRYEAGVLEQTLAAEQIDVAASNTFAQGLTQAFGGAPELAGNQLVNAHCRATLCRLAVLQRSDEDMESFLGNVGSLPGLENTETYWQREINADGSSVMTMYVARKGHKLPDYGLRGPDSLVNRSDGS